MKIKVPVDGHSFAAFAMIVDVNGFTSMVARGGDAQFTRDILVGGIECVEKNGGEVVGLMGDAFYGVLASFEDVVNCCAAIAKDTDRQCEYISHLQAEDPEIFSFSPGGPSLKVGVEYGTFDVSHLHTTFMGNQFLVIGPAVIQACRIAAAGIGNRCLIGPNAVKFGLDNYGHRLIGPFNIEGKSGEPIYEYYELDIGEWRAGETTETYWG